MHSKWIVIQMLKSQKSLWKPGNQLPWSWWTVVDCWIAISTVLLQCFCFTAGKSWGSFSSIETFLIAYWSCGGKVLCSRFLFFPAEMGMSYYENSSCNTVPATSLSAFKVACVFVCFSYSYMIDNIILLITGTLHQRPITELVPKCHPLGSFEEMASINIASTPADLYNAVMIDTPLGITK